MSSPSRLGMICHERPYLSLSQPHSLGASMTPGGTTMAQAHLKPILLYLDMQVIGQPEFYLSMAQDKFDATVVLTDEYTKGLLAKGLAVLASK